MNMPDDIVADLGFLALGTRLKRLGEQLQAGVGEALAAEGKDVQPGQLPLLLAIAEGGGSTIVQLVRAIGVSQPAVSRMIAGLQRSGLVTISNDSEDARVRRAALTSKSQALLLELRQSVFTRVAQAAEQLCEGTGLLGALAIVEERNKDVPFAERIRRARP